MPENTGASRTRPAAGRPPRLFLHAGKPIASRLDYDVPFIPVETVISPVRTGMCVPLSRFARRASLRERCGPRTEAVDVAAAPPGTLPTGGDPPIAPKP